MEDYIPYALAMELCYSRTLLIFDKELRKLRVCFTLLLLANPTRLRLALYTPRLSDSDSGSKTN